MFLMGKILLCLTHFMVVSKGGICTGVKKIILRNNGSFHFYVMANIKKASSFGSFFYR